MNELVVQALHIKDREGLSAFVRKLFVHVFASSRYVLKKC